MPVLDADWHRPPGTRYARAQHASRDEAVRLAYVAFALEFGRQASKRATVELVGLAAVLTVEHQRLPPASRPGRGHSADWVAILIEEPEVAESGQPH